MMRWRAWYADGRQFSSRDAAPEDLPREGLVCVVEYQNPPYKNVFHGEYTLWLDGEWMIAQCDCAKNQGALVFPGKLMPDAEWDRVQAEALASAWE